MLTTVDCCYAHTYAVAHSAAEIEAVLAESAVIAEGCQVCAAGHIAGMVGSSAFCAVVGKHGRLERLLRKVDGVGLLL